MSPRWRDAGLLAVLLVACGQKDAPPRTTTGATDASAPGDAAPEGASARADEKEKEEVLPWGDAIRAGRWMEAQDGLAALAPAEQGKAEVRLARARVAIALKKHADAVAMLEKLDEELPLLRDVIARLRAQAMFEVGPYDRAAEYFATRRDASSLALAGEAWEKAGDATKAKVAWDRMIAAEKRSRAQEERARYRRMSIVRLKEGDPAAQADARWLTTNALDDKVFTDSAELLENLKPPRLLTSEELMTRARVLAEAARSEPALRAIERAATRASIPANDLCRARAEVYWKARTRYPEAALAYRSCAAMGGAHAAEDLFLSARSFVRAERDVDAVPAFQSVIQKHPRTTYAEQAEYHIARIHFLAGRFKDAAFAFDEYAKHWSNGKEKKEADRYRALAHLVSGNHKRARKLLEELSGGAEDPITGARWQNLAALAALRDGDKLHALARWAEVARTKPLTWPALVARARIAEHGGTVPPAIEPAESGALEPIPVDLPPPADMLHRIGFEAEAEETLREREAVVIAKTPTRGTDALCTAYAQLDRAKRRYQIALGIPQQLVMSAPGGKNRTAWECLFPKPHAVLVRAAGARARVSPDLVWAVMRQESGFDPEVVSPARAVGLMQLLPETARDTAKAKGIAHDDGLLTSPSQSTLLGALYLREVLDGLGENTTLAVAAYNAGPEAIHRWLGHLKGVSLDVFVEAIPYLETRGYVVRVLGNLARYGYLDRGDAGIPSLSLELK